MQEGGQERWDAQNDPEYSQRLLAYLLGRYKAWLLSGACSMALIAVIVALFQAASYSSYGSVKVSKSGGPAVSLLSVLPALGGSAPILDEMALLSSREIGLPVLEASNLQAVIHDPRNPDALLGRLDSWLKRGGSPRQARYERLSLSAVTVSDELLSEQHLWISADASGNWKCAGQSGANGSPLETAQFSFTPQFGALHRAGDRYRITIKPNHEAWTDFRNALGIRQHPPDSNYLRISFSHRNPWVAQQVAQQVLDRYLEHTAETTYGDFDTLLSFIAEEQAKGEARLEAATAELKEFQEAHGVFAPDAQGSVSVQAIADLSRRKTEDGISLKQSQYLLGILEQRSPEEIYEAIQAPGIAEELEGQSDALAGLIQQLRVERQTKTDAHPEVQTLQARIKSAIASLKQATEARMRNLRTSIGQVETDISSYRAELHKLPEATGRLALLQSDINSDLAVLGLLRQHEATTRLSRAGKSTEVRVIDLPAVPAKRDSPRLGRSAVLGAAAGLLLAFLFALGYDGSRRGFRSLRELRLGAGLTVLAVLPGRPLRGNWRPLPAPAGTAALTSQLLAGRRTLGIVNLGGPQASHSLVWSLAQELSRRGQPVIVLDLDRAASLRGAFKLDDVPGFAELAAGSVELSAAARPVGDGIRLLAPGRAQAGAEQVTAAWVRLLDGGATVLCNMPAPAQWTVQAALLPLLGGLVLSTAQAAVPAGAVALAANRLGKLGKEPLGIVVTEFSGARDALGSAELPYLTVDAPGRL